MVHELKTLGDSGRPDQFRSGVVALFETTLNPENGFGTSNGTVIIFIDQSVARLDSPNRGPHYPHVRN